MSPVSESRPKTGATAMEEQLRRLDGMDFSLYTDDSRVVMEDRLTLSVRI